ncbi:hypothetical protein EYZ11_011770 [Aspergillus tanneri]|nr:hypothetical protein EYZ11_011770 [Aspergillus tanneri]
MFGPYTPLQQLDLLADCGTKSYVVGSTNSLLLQQKDRYSDVLINLDEGTISIPNPSLRSALTLSVADRRWIDLLTQIINDTWDEAHPQQPKTHGYMGSEEFIRLQFEEYLLALLSCMKYHEDLNSFNAGEPGRKTRAQLEAFNIEGDPALEFNSEFLKQWQNTSNYALFKNLTSDALLFSIVEPRHPCAGGLTIDDIQRRLTQQVTDLHLDEKVREGREALNRHIGAGQKKVSAAFNSFWADVESMREAQRKKNEEKVSQSERSSMDKGSPPPFSRSDSASVASSGGSSWFAARKAPTVDVAQAQASVSAVGQRAGAYLSSWTTWASEKRKEWQEKKPSPSSSCSPASITSPSTTLAGTTETGDTERGRRDSIQVRRSEDSTSLSRSGSRRKRWSNILLRRESGEFGASQKRDDRGSDNTEHETAYSRSPLSREASILGDNDPEPADLPFTESTAHSKTGYGDTRETHSFEKEPKPTSDDEREDITTRTPAKDSGKTDELPPPKPQYDINEPTPETSSLSNK